LCGEDRHRIKEAYVDPMLTNLRSVTPFGLMTRSGLPHQVNLLNRQTESQWYTFYEAVQLLNGSGGNQRAKYKSAYMRKAFPQEQIAAIYHWLTTVPTGLSKTDLQQSLLQIDTYGGKINLVNPSATAVPQRSSVFKLQYQTYWNDPVKDVGHLAWIRGFYDDVYKSSGGTPDPQKDPTGNVDGCYYNYPDLDLNGPDNNKEKALALYFGQNLPRLKSVKLRWDPNNYFNSGQSI